jgi:tetratricopeptide (TPR) repeat protein
VISHFENNPIESTVLRKSFQKVTYAKGLQAFSDRQLDQAFEFLTKSVRFPEDPALARDGYYWLGETAFLLEDYGAATESYEKAVGMDQNFMLPVYGLAYLSFNARNYETARNLFTRFLSRSARQHPLYDDALLRRADCQYALKNYQEALEDYRSLKGSSVAQDYIYYQTGLIEQLQGHTLAAVNSFDELEKYPASPYRDNALFQKAQTFFEDAQFDQAEAYFTQYIDEYPSESLAPYAYNKRALGYFNNQDYERAKKDYLKVLEDHIGHPAAKDAILGIQELQKQGVSVDFETYFATYQAAHPEDSSVKSIRFEQAKNLYFAQKYGEAIVQFEEVLADSNSPFQEDALYYMADAYQRTAQYLQANKYYEQLLSLQGNQYRNRVYDRRGKVLLILENYPEASDNYSQLLSRARNRRELYTAHEGLMKSQFHQTNYGDCLKHARAILDLEWKPSNAERQAYLYMGRTYEAQGQREQALDAYIQVINAAPDVLGAEARYRMADMMYRSAEHNSSLQILFQLNADYGTYQNWVGKSFLLIADNYIAMEEWLQAKATLQSLIDHFPDEGVKNEAREKMLTIKAQEAREVNKSERP